MLGGLKEQDLKGSRLKAAERIDDIGGLAVLELIINVKFGNELIETPCSKLQSTAGRFDHKEVCYFQIRSLTLQ